MRTFRHILLAGICVLGTAAFAGCRLVDEDVSDCGEELSVDYELQLVTNMRTEIQTVLDLQTDLQMATTLQDHLGEVFTDFAHDVDLSFYDTEEPYARLEHIGVVMDGSESSYSIFLPGRSYTHTCVANLEAEPYLSLEGADYYPTARLVQYPEVKDTVRSHSAGIFAARARMDVISGEDQQFNVELYMVNAATALILDMSDAPEVQDLKVYLSGFADGFMLADSVYTFNTRQIVRTQLLPSEPGSTERCYTSFHFPSRDVEDGTKMVIDMPDPEGDKRSEEVLWYWIVDALMKDNTVTHSMLGCFTPLHAGQLKAVKAVIHANGGLVTKDPTVGASITLDWHEGMDISVNF